MRVTQEVMAALPDGTVIDSLAGPCFQTLVGYPAKRRTRHHWPHWTGSLTAKVRVVKCSYCPRRLVRSHTNNSYVPRIVGYYNAG